MASVRTVIKSDKAPAAIGPYSQAIRSGDTLYCSGQVGIDPATGKLVDGGVEAQAQQVLKNLEAVLQAAGAGFANVVKTTIFLTDMGDFSKVNAIYGERFGDSPPARATIAVAALPAGAVVEIDAVAAL